MNDGGLPMIITQLNGGLGNQMFQYAIGRTHLIAIAREHPYELEAEHRVKVDHRVEQFGQAAVADEEDAPQ